jgi:transcriptional regulator with XRE-family HTH domain
MGARLQAIRNERGLTKAALARLVGLSPSAFAKIENGGQSGVEIIEALAKATGVSPAWLAFNEGPRILPSPRRGRRPAQSSVAAG